MALRYFTLTPRARTRMIGEVFNSDAAAEIYGEDAGRIGVEERFNNVRTAVAHLLHNHHYDGDVKLGNLINNLREKHDKMMALSEAEDYFGAERKAKIKYLMRKVVLAGQDDVNPSFHEDDIRRFVELAIAGRAHYETQDFNPDEFIDHTLVAFASMVVGNFDAYHQTLNHKYVADPV